MVILLIIISLLSVAVIGFLNTTVSLVEGNSVLNISIGVLQGSLDALVNVIFITEDMTAKGMWKSSTMHNKSDHCLHLVY